MVEISQSQAEELVRQKLDEAYEIAENFSVKGDLPDLGLSQIFIDALEFMSEASSKATTGFTNLITALSIKSAFPHLDVRYHQVQIGAPFSFRGVSEKAVYPWLSKMEFEGAKSGWQTRTFERPKPYIMTYDENIGAIKQPFLTCYDQVEEHKEDPINALIFLIYKQIELRNSKIIVLACPQIRQIHLIAHYFSEHFFFHYKNKGAARLPVLAIYSIYKVLVDQLERFNGMSLKELEEHSAADSQTQSVGDIEVKDANDGIFEAVEIKHNIAADKLLETDLFKKVAPYRVSRYYWLTTHKNCTPNEEQTKELEKFENRIGCQVIVNGVIPTIKYYLRLLTDPSVVFPIYIKLIKSDRALSHEHRIAWNTIVQSS
jgi:DNA (cytosine-5)-methyltransferase 1